MIDKIEERKSQYRYAELRLAMVRSGAEILPYFGTVVFLHKTDNIQNEVNLDYNEMVMLKKSLPLEEGIQLINSIQANREVKIGDYVLPPLDVDQKIERTSLHKEHRYEEYIDWPTEKYRLHYRQFPKVPSNPLVKLGLPYYPSTYLALNHFFGFNASDRSGELWIFVPDYRVRFDSMRLDGRIVLVKVNTREIDPKDVVTKVYAIGGGYSDKNPFIAEVRSNSAGEAKFEMGTLPSMIELCALVNGDIVDVWKANIMLPLPKDVIVDYPAGLVEILIEGGENSQVEFKEKVDSFNKILETAIAFANAEGGHILLGVDDDGKIVGCEISKKELEERLRNAIESQCEPPVHFETFEVPFGEKKVFDIYIHEGNNKPYFLRDKGFLIRRGASNRLMRRSELDAVYQKRGN